MAVTGPEPKANKIGRTPTAVEWIEVPNVPYDGPVPQLPATRSCVTPEGVALELDINERTRAWWAVVSRMPHCRLWTDADWQFALDTALLKDAFYAAPAQTVAIAVEIRRREDQLGTTGEARRKLRIRYVDPVETTEPEPDTLEFGHMTVRQLRAWAKERRVDLGRARRKDEILEVLAHRRVPATVTRLDERRRRLTGAS